MSHGAPRDLGGLVDGEPVLAGQVVRVVTTGGGGWGDPLEREPELVLRDVIEGKVSPEAARARLRRRARRAMASGRLAVDDAATAKLRGEHARRAQRPAADDRPRPGLREDAARRGTSRA